MVSGNEIQHFNKLFKVNTINELLNLDSELIEGTVTRNLESDYRRALSFMRYGFEEGIKFIKNKIKVEQMEATQSK